MIVKAGHCRELLTVIRLSRASTDSDTKPPPIIAQGKLFQRGKHTHRFKNEKEKTTIQQRKRREKKRLGRACGCFASE